VKTLFLVSLCCLIVFCGPSAQALDRSIFSLENYEARAAVKEVLISSLAELEGVKPALIAQRESALRVQFRVESQGGFLYLLFLNESEGAFPVAGRGNIIIKRDMRDGRFVQMKLFLRAHSECFIRIFPAGKRSLMDVTLFGEPLYQKVLLPLEFTQLLDTPFSEIVSLTAATVDWPLLLYEGRDEEDRRGGAIAQRIRELVPRLKALEDGAMDARGKYVLIAGGAPQGEPGGFNCSGFAKWVVDGFIIPLLGRGLEIESLKKKRTEVRGNRWNTRYEQQRDPYFGLDWSRNLAIALLEAREGRAIADPERADVRQVQFLRYTEDVGYPLHALELLLFLDCQKNPGSFYLGSVNGEYGREPVLHQHFHLVVFFPYFTAGGEFKTAAFEINRETGLESLKARFKQDYIHLVRLSCGGTFSPPAVE